MFLNVYFAILKAFENAKILCITVEFSLLVMFEEAKWDLRIVRFEGRVSSCDYSPSQMKDDLSWSKSTPIPSKIIKQGVSIIMITTSEEKCDKKLWETVVYPRGFLQKTT